ncbi:permease prefix domain 1-containing protein [Acrocarpospora catenulata]|uniref:permease prefix domain 1-containing protein n=1 Tax=Acrocarpospora catenulata TaxID=2836182 RepID=UPI001BDA208D|nr:permease prefix domain 1-containing protein [Acrocarpospora catenulata]
METLIVTDSVDEYADSLRRALRGPGRLKRDMVAEVRDGLRDAADAYRAEGLGPREAERRAVAEFGSVAEIAPEFQRELTAGQGRRTALLLFLTVPAVAVLWTVIWKFFPAGPVSVHPGWYGPVARAVDLIQLATGLYGGLALWWLRRGRRPDLVARSLGLLMWIQLPVLGALCTALMHGSSDSMTHMGYPPGLVATGVSVVFWVWQLHSAARCLAVSGRG